MLHSFDHAVIAVRDLAAATERTAAWLGRAPSWRGVHPGAGTANALFRLENCYIELLARAGEGAIGRLVDSALDTRGEGLLALAFGTDDVGACVERLRRFGLDVADPAAGEGRLAGADGAEAGSSLERRWSNVLLPVAATRGLPLMLIQHHSPASALPLREPAVAPEAAIAALDHAVVLSGDPAASGAVYGDTLGLRLALDRDFEARGIRILFYRVGGVTVEVAGPLRAGGDAEEPDRFGGLAYRVPDIDAVRARLAAAGFDVSATRAGHKPGTRVCSLRSGTCGVPTLLLSPAPSRPHGGR